MGSLTAETSTLESAELKDVKVANEILDIVEMYGISEKTDQELPCKARTTFLPIVLAHIRKGVAIRMVLPAFPFKSPNRGGKVLGALPDLGEEVALRHLQGFCDSINQAYMPGAEILIVSDGLVYNDLLRVTDEDVWTYGETLRQMVLDSKLVNIRFVRLLDLLDVSHHESNPVLNSPGHITSEDRTFYLAHASCLRRELLARYEPSGFDAKQAIKDDTDTCLTYRGYLRFLKKDLEHIKDLRLDQDGFPLSAKKYDRVISCIAQKMITRGAAFAAAIKATHGDCVRLSIHPTIAVTKFPVQLIPQQSGSFGQTPWHSSIGVGLDGSFTAGHAEDFHKTHDVIYRAGRPYYFREKSELYHWGDLKVEFEHLYPCGLIIRPLDGSPSIRDVPMKKVRQLATNLSPVVLRGFSETLDESVYVAKAHEAGKVLPWTFGIIQKVKDAGVDTKMGNNVTSNEGMPMHFDGMFKFEERINPATGQSVKVQVPPGFQFFTALATAPEGTGYTLFASSRLFFQHLRAPYNAERFEKIKWNMDNDGFWDAKLKDLPLIVRHPVTNAPCLRWHEPWTRPRQSFLPARLP
ncbi:Pyoverdine/dityrosine biosynthesis protein-domain-containing protein [Bisporella sp. PMI_857]|nr:Pyoverdine/dityrosine biosynthesis protein-domain-containing protein [Bisporella sp. PMI_857]